MSLFCPTPIQNGRQCDSGLVKTNAVRVLDQLGIPYELRNYTVDPDDLSADTVAQKINIPIEQVFKTLVAKGDLQGVCLGVVPGHLELDLKALARFTGDRKVDLAPLKDLQPLTGYIRGGVTAFGGKKEYPVYLDESALSFERISVSAGIRGTQILLTPDDYLRATRAIVVSIAKPK